MRMFLLQMEVVIDILHERDEAVAKIEPGAHFLVGGRQPWTRRSRGRRRLGEVFDQAAPAGINLLAKKTQSGIGAQRFVERVESFAATPKDFCRARRGRIPALAKIDEDALGGKASQL